MHSQFIGMQLIKSLFDLYYSVFSLQDFYSEINRKEMYIRYVNKLCDLHLECDNFTEAAYTLQLHSKLLQWSDNTLPPLLKSNRYPDAQTHRHLKEALYYNIIDHYNKGKVVFLISLFFLNK